MHLIHRDENEKYVVVVEPGGVIKVWDHAGNQKLVNNTSVEYLADVTSPEDTLKLLTVADHTFIVNMGKVVLEGLTYTDTRPYEALVNVLAGNYARTYRIFINGAQQAAMRTPDGGSTSHNAYVDTNFIAERLRSSLVEAHADTSLDAFSLTNPTNYYAYSGTGILNATPWGIARYQHVLYITNMEEDFTISTEDGYANKAMVAVKGHTQKFSDLPVNGPDGIVIEVSGAEGVQEDSYWVRFEKTNDATSAGIWKECVCPGTRLGFRNDTAPHVLVREADGTFTFKSATWEERKCGDTDKNPDPSFVNSTIEDVFFFRNRLGLLTKENIVQSSSGKDGFWNFYRGTLTALLDTDPIDVASNHVKVTKLRHAVPYSGELLVFSDSTQFLLKGNDMLTPKTVNSSPLSELNVTRQARPIVAGSSLFFVSEGDDWTTALEYFIDKSIESADYSDITSHVPAYIPSGVIKVVGNPNMSLMAVLSKKDPNCIYIYKYFYNNQEKLQSAWQRWVFPGVTQIHTMDFDNENLKIVATRGSEGVFLESMKCGAGVKDTGLPYQITLDRSVILTGSYDANSHTTSYTLPYLPDVNIKAVDPSTGALVGYRSMENYTMTFAGNRGALRFGWLFEARHRFSTFFLREAENTKVTRAEGRLTIHGLQVNFAKATEFSIEVTPQGRTTKVYKYYGLNPKDGHTYVPVMSRNDRVTIDLVVKSHRPTAFVSGVWSGQWNSYNRQR